MLDQADPSTPPKRERRTLRRLCMLILSIGIGLLLCEGLLRYSLFGDSSLAKRLGATTRDPGLFAAPKIDDAYWILSHNLSGKRQAVPGPDPVLGWRGSKRIRKRDFAHQGELELNGRRPILMFGDSYTNCVIPSEQCWEGLIEEGPLGDDYKLLNYGVGGFGVDQIYLLLRDALVHWDTRTSGPRPLVIVAIMVDDDLDRVALSVRDWPKPRFELVDDELVLEPPTMPKQGSLAPVLQPEITSYLWRYLVYGTKLLPDGLRQTLIGTQRDIEEKRQLNARLIREIQLELDSRGLDSFFVIFPGTAALGSKRPWGWQEPLLEETFTALGAPFVNAKHDLRADMAETGRRIPGYFGRVGVEKGHYSAEGNRVAMRAIYRGLAGDFDSPQ